MEGPKRSQLRVRLRVTARRRGGDGGADGGGSGGGGGGAGGRKRLLDAPAFNSAAKLQRREIGGRQLAARGGGAASAVPERFRNMHLQEEFDTYDHNAHLFVKLQFLKKRSKIIEIVAAKDIIFALAHSGLCAAFSRVTNKRISFLNLSPDEVIRSLFYNKNNDSLITVSVYASDHFSTLKCRTTPIEYIRRNQLDAGFPLFETESLKWPGFVEFDDVNGKVLTYSAQDGIYKVFDLKNYSFLYSIPDTNVQEIKISPGIMLLIYERTPCHVPLKILSIEDGRPLKSFTHLLHRNKKIDFIEQFNEKLLVKQEDENLQILDVRSSELIEVSVTKFMTPSAFIFLYENNLFLTFRNRTVAVWNFRGELVTSFEDHLLWHQDCSTNNIYITSDQDLIISYCKSEAGVDDGTVPPIGSINMSDIMTGKCIAKIAANDPTLRIGPRKNGNSERSSIWSTIPEALEDVTALFYDEDRNEIYTGNRHGLVHVWSN
ncbi:uncharacterized protein [Oryza sativa Japonica Group]|uniref:Expressed protein n=2 Tax=Oryza TaxID=4527 RepID=Q2QQD3_ORYSJ|nr:uncharacterized protein LOC9266982 [Oryza sativa Japonica Group]ABA98599.1 expressed protein [Oryza sativa Japonica Group]KAB8117540.1 hypothetical protein EE612_059682 [Oryza sativa]KAF2907908.1 hypothetical protein DAI22_12g135500 [Oryza sativa Japonica Group]BAT17233.1 Os12g0498300 [Oryza sativa Japonica Group]